MIHKYMVADQTNVEDDRLNLSSSAWWKAMVQLLSIHKDNKLVYLGSCFRTSQREIFIFHFILDFTDFDFCFTAAADMSIPRERLKPIDPVT